MRTFLVFLMVSMVLMDSSEGSHTVSHPLIEKIAREERIPSQASEECHLC